ncbi:MAG: hypothetical protein ACYTE6_02245, partial [Planctomycetota bacterium]
SFFFGLPHTPLGNATLGLDPSSGELVVSNLGSSGQDGVSIGLGGVTGFRAAVDIGPQGELPPGAIFQMDAFAPAPVASGQSQKTLGLLICEILGGQAAVSLDTSFFSPASLRVQARLDGVVVDSVVLEPPFPTPLITGEMGTGGFDEPVGISFPNDSTSSVQPGSTEMLSMDMSGTNITIAGSVPVIADEILVSGTSAAAPPPIQSIEMRAGGINEMRISDEAVQMFGSDHRALGQAHLAGACLLTGGCLVVSNFGSSGSDGLSVDKFERVLTWGFNVDPVLQPGGQLDVDADMRSVVGSAVSVQFTLRETTAATLELLVDFSSLGSSSQMVEVFLDGAIIGTVSGQTGPVATTGGGNTDNPECLIWDIKDSCAHAEADWDPPRAMDVPGLGLVTADRLRVTPEIIAGDPVVFESINAVAMTASNTDTLTFYGEFTEQASACPWDCGDGDGAVGVVDFLAMIAGWGLPGPCDFDGDAKVGITDFLILLANWGSCS